MKASKDATGPRAAGTRTRVSYKQGHWGQPQGLTSMCDMWHEGKQIGKSTNKQKIISAVYTYINKTASSDVNASPSHVSQAHAYQQYARACCMTSAQNDSGLAMVPMTPGETHAFSLRRSSREHKKPKPYYAGALAEPPEKPSSGKGLQRGFFK